MLRATAARRLLRGYAAVGKPLTAWRALCSSDDAARARVAAAEEDEAAAAAVERARDRMRDRLQLEGGTELADMIDYIPGAQQDVFILGTVPGAARSAALVQSTLSLLTPDSIVLLMAGDADMRDELYTDSPTTSLAGGSGLLNHFLRRLNFPTPELAPEVMHPEQVVAEALAEEAGIPVMYAERTQELELQRLWSVSSFAERVQIVIQLHVGLAEAKKSSFRPGRLTYEASKQLMRGCRGVMLPTRPQQYVTTYERALYLLAAIRDAPGQKVLAVVPEVMKLPLEQLWHCEQPLPTEELQTADVFQHSWQLLEETFGEPDRAPLEAAVARLRNEQMRPEYARTLEAEDAALRRLQDAMAAGGSPVQWLAAMDKQEDVREAGDDVQPALDEEEAAGAGEAGEAGETGETGEAAEAAEADESVREAEEESGGSDAGVVSAADESASKQKRRAVADPTMIGDDATVAQGADHDASLNVTLKHMIASESARLSAK
eukprot:PLAT8350.2.p1 GENE.PLAT8350.2~~PLAT8350.2.p1  ORF type:complete len:492 (+),score=200.14 PLAT8350.2:292-1767(+)